MAADIGVKIGVQGDEQYKQSLKDIIQETKTLNAEMKKTESSFDSSAKAQDKAAAKLEVLNKQVEKQKEYIEKLKEQIAGASKEYDENSSHVLKLKENLAKAETALNKMESDQRSLNEELRKAPWDEFKNKMDEVGEKLNKVGEGMKTVGTNMSKYVTAPIAAVAGLSVKAFTEVDDAMDELVKMTGKTGDELADLQSTVESISTTLPVTFEDAAKAVGEVNTRFDASGDLADSLSQKFLKFAKITDSDVVDAIDSTQHAMAAWGLSTDKAGDYLDVLAKVAQDTGTSVDTLNQVVGDNKVIFDEMGMSVFTAANFVGELDKAGVDSSTAMAGLKKAMQNATKEGKPLDQALKELSDTLANGESDTEAYQEAMDLFGNKAGPQLAEALKSGKISLTDFSRVAADSMGSVDQTFEDMLDPADKFTTAMNELKLLGADVGGTLLEALAPAFETVGNALKSVAEWWASLSPEMQNTILIVAGIVAAIGPVVSIVGNIITVVSTLIPIIGAVTAAIGAMDIALGPIILIIAAVAAAIAGIILVIKNWGKITEWFGKVWEDVTGWIKQAAEDVGNWVSDKWDKITSWTSEAWENVKSWTSEAWENVKTTVKDAVDNVKEKVHEKWEQVKSNTKEAWENIKSKVEENGGGIQGFLATVEEEIKNGWAAAFEWINEKTGGKLGEVWQTVTDKLAEIKQKFVDKWEEIKSTVSDAIEKIKGFFKFDWELPKIKLPHFTITGKFSLNPPQIPHFSVDWYKNAYSNPVMFNSPTVLGTMGGLKGFGDGSGGEIVIGEKMMYSMIQQAVRSGGGTNNTYDISITVNGAAGQNVEDLAEAVAEQLAFEIERREAALA